MVKADTLENEELADKLGFAGEARTPFSPKWTSITASSTLRRTTISARRPTVFSELRTAPFYGTWFGGSILTTVDGLRINPDMQVLDEQGHVIEGLYAAGDCSGSVFANNYPEYIVGCAWAHHHLQPPRRAPWPAISPKGIAGSRRLLPPRPACPKRGSSFRLDTLF